MHFQSTLFASDATTPAPLRPDRTWLSSGTEHQSAAWVDVQRGWLGDPDGVFATMAEEVPWHAERRQMYERLVHVPRLLHTYGIGATLPHPALTEAMSALNEHYLPELGEPFVTAGCCFYRDGQDSVAWHGDTVGRGRTHDTMIAIVSLGDPRRLALRPREGVVPADGVGGSLSLTLGHGDLVVMGGSCQRTWEHAVPKQAQAGPRISVQFRARNVF
ncbi:alpha-ketoglutarate-dependent dioxygenase AlkB [Nocardioides yefusunii]|uniref:Alpha-ketoglutarate-dependent dioxygenase AlkB n=1 Tax=Nocardioides yefusunii TaxID=2500546 RepID=A0ABW1QYE1_9ACTN|nr:alpha-ketoglutarate-dependent dioxygenase AlkB [Nocardioides yefusunii]